MKVTYNLIYTGILFEVGKLLAQLSCVLSTLTEREKNKTGHGGFCFWLLCVICVEHVLQK